MGLRPTTPNHRASSKRIRSKPQAPRHCNKQRSKHGQLFMLWRPMVTKRSRRRIRRPRARQHRRKHASRQRSVQKWRNPKQLPIRKPRRLLGCTQLQIVRQIHRPLTSLQLVRGLKSKTKSIEWYRGGADLVYP